jgi:hypothetical protein
MHHARRSLPALLALGLAVLGLAGCELPGEVAPPAKPELHVSEGTKQLRFDWNAADGAASYRLMQTEVVQTDGGPVLAWLPTGAELTQTECDLDITVHRTDWSHARFKISACNELGCTDSNEVDASGSMLSTIGRIEAQNAAANAHFGAAVAVSGDGGTMAVGAPRQSSGSSGVNPVESGTAAIDSGAVYVFDRGSGWAQAAFLKASAAEPGAGFGWSVALSADGRTLAVGAPFADSKVGAAYVFIRDGGGWVEEARLTASDAQPSQNLGSSVSLSSDGSTLAAGAPGDAGGAGAVHLFLRGDGGWVENAHLTAPGARQGDNLGWSVSLSGDGSAIAVGAPHAESDAGAVHVFSRGETGWAEGTSPLPAGLAGYRLGYSVSLSADGSGLAAGAPGADSQGAVCVSSRSGADWASPSCLAAPSPGVGDRFGIAVASSADGSTLAVGADEEDGGAPGVGGDPADDSVADSGAIYQLKRSGETFALEAYVKAPRPGEGNAFGCAVSLSSDGNTLAAGAYLEDGGATQAAGQPSGTGSLADSGAVYLY